MLYCIRAKLFWLRSTILCWVVIATPNRPPPKKKEIQQAASIFRKRLIMEIGFCVKVITLMGL